MALSSVGRRGHRRRIPGALAVPSGVLLLGINLEADASAVLLADGRPVAAVAEERLRRVKHWMGFPSGSIRTCLEIAGVDARDLTGIAMNRDLSAHRVRRAWSALRRDTRPGAALLRWRRAGGEALRGALARALDLPAEALPPRHAVEHHSAHLASAFLASPFDRAAVASLDGFGDFVSAARAEGRGGRLRVLDRVFHPHSLGAFYSALSQHLGFPHYGDEPKVMALAALGEPRFAAELRRMLRLRPDGRFRLDLSCFRWGSGRSDRAARTAAAEGEPSRGAIPLYSPELVSRLGPPRAPDASIDDRHRDLAASLQAVFEEAAVHFLRGLHRRVRSPRLCLAGGCAHNSVLVGRIVGRTPFEEVFVPPGAGDEGGALGAALAVHHAEPGRRREWFAEHALLGNAYPDAALETALRPLAGRFAIARHATDASLARDAAERIADGAVLGWFQGRMEWGPRALGARSILADPRRPDLRERLNRRIKHREPFRPFACSILERFVPEWFADAAPDPFMVRVHPVRPERRAQIPAVVHADGSGRHHAVRDDVQPLFAALLRELHARTGVPCVLDTSFNDDEPIVESPAQAVAAFLRSEMDALALGPWLVSRRRPG